MDQKPKLGRLPLSQTNRDSSADVFSFHSYFQICDDELRLLAVQQSLQAEGGNAFNVPLVGLSLNNTVRQCLTHDMAKKAEKVRTDFKIPDKR